MRALIRRLQAALRKLHPYAPPGLADLSRDDVDPYWPAVRDMLPDCAHDRTQTPQQGEAQQ